MNTIILTKKNPVISLKKESLVGKIGINLNWSQKKGFFASVLGTNADLDLGCLYELKNGRKGCVQALGNAFGSLQSEPYIKLDHDDRTGESDSGENMDVNASKWNHIQRVLVFAYIYNGVSNWNGIDGVVTVKVAGHEDIVVNMENAQNGKTMCAIAMLENDNGSIKVTRLEEYFKGHEAMDRAHGWNMNWTPGRK
ncbi:TerD family protein [Vibrio parahaemolyticus]|uniref:TerD family protein n=1 Tax=Vibrio parahaemolyticus TaxID=670 RepID=UPI001E502932|nr:hypothetical protein [Vibrio parahaemolyticus]